MRGLEVRRYTSDTVYELIDRTTSTERRGFVSVEASMLYDEPGFLNLTVDSQTAEEHGLADQVVIGIGVIYDSAPSEEFARYTIESSQRRMLGDGRLAWSFSGRSMLARLEDAVVYPSAWPSPVPAGHAFVDATAGTQMRTLTDRAQLRGTITDIDDSTFTGALTSNGVSWSKIISITHGNGTSYLQVLQDLMTKGMCEQEMVGKQLRLYNPDTVLSVHHADIILRRGDNLSEAELDTDSRELGNVIFIEGDVNAAQEYVDTAAVTALGRRRERYVSHGGIVDSGTLQLLAQAEADLYNDVLQEVNVEIPALDIYPQPWKDFKPGHWIWVEQGQAFQEVRVRQMTLAQDEQGRLTATITLNDKIAEDALKLQRKIDAITGNSQYGAISNPDQADNTVPLPPPTVSITSGAYILPNGTVNAQITVTWSAPAANTDASSYDDPGGFEVQYQIGAQAWTPMGTVDSGTLAAFASGLEPGNSIKARVRAFDTSNHYSGYTTSSTITTAGDSNPPAQPSTPTVDTAPLALKVTWDGLTSSAGNMAADVYRVWVHVSTTNGFTASAGNRYASFGARGLQTLYAIDLTYGTTYYFRLTAEDWSGTIGPQSNQASAVFPQITTVDVVDGLVTDIKLADGAVKTPKIFPEAVTTEKLTVGAFADSVLPNGNMEQAKELTPTEPANWFRNGQTGAGLPIVFDTSSPIAGDASLRMDPTTVNGQTAVSEVIDVPPGTVWFVGAKVKTSLDPGTPQAIPTVFGTGAVVSGTAGVSAALPAGVQEFDIIYLFCQSAGGEAVATPSGYALVDPAVVQGAGVTGTRLTVFWKRAGTSEGAISITDPGDHIIARTMGVRGARRVGTPHEAMTPSTEAVADTTGSISGGTTNGANRLVVAAASGQRAVTGSTTTEYSGFTNAALANMAERIDNLVDIGTIDGALGVVTGEKASAGAIGATTFTQAGNALKAMLSFAVMPLDLSQLGYVKVDLQTATTAANLDSSPTITSIYASAGDDTPVPAEVDGGATIPANHRYARVALTADIMPVSYSVWFDDVEFRKIVGTAQIANLAVVDAKIQSLTASKITVGILTADITLSARLKTADTGQRWEANALGSQVYRADGTKATEMSPTGLSAFATDGTTPLFQALASTGAIILRSGTSGPRIEINTTADAASFRLYTGSADQTATPAKITTDFNDAISPREAWMDVIGPNVGQDIPPKITLLGKRETTGGNPNNNTILVQGIRSFKVVTANHATEAILVNEATERVNIEPPWNFHTRDIASDSYIGMSGDGWNMRARNPPAAAGAWGQWWGTNGNVAMTLGGDDTVRSTNAGGGAYKPMQASAFQVSSDFNIKRKVKTIPKGQVEKIKGLRAITFEYANDPDQGMKRGVVAQEIQEHIPEAYYETDEGEKMVDLMGLASTLLSAIQELEERIRDLEQQ